MSIELFISYVSVHLLASQKSCIGILRDFSWINVQIVRQPLQSKKVATIALSILSSQAKLRRDCVPKGSILILYKFKLIIKVRAHFPLLLLCLLQAHPRWLSGR